MAISKTAKGWLVEGPGVRWEVATRAEAEQLHRQIVPRRSAVAAPRTIESNPIAAQLLEALKNLVAETERRDNTVDQGVSQHSEAMAIARHVIAKAEGTEEPNVD